MLDKFAQTGLDLLQRHFFSWLMTQLKLTFESLHAIIYEAGKAQQREAELTRYGIHVIGVEGSRWSYKAA